MHIKLIKKILYFSQHKVKCAIGENGIAKNKKEGDLRTPQGKFKFLGVLYRKDRVGIIRSSLKTYAINKKLGWCDDSKSKNYNKLIKYPFKYKAEKLYLRKKIYDIILIINYNIRPTIKKKGSAIFLHIATKKYSPTRGCVAVSKKDMRKLLKFINKKTIIEIF